MALFRNKKYFKPNVSELYWSFWEFRIINRSDSSSFPKEWKLPRRLSFNLELLFFLYCVMNLSELKNISKEIILNAVSIVQSIQVTILAPQCNMSPFSLKTRNAVKSVSASEFYWKRINWKTAGRVLDKWSISSKNTK